MIVNVTPSPISKSETLCSLTFASRCRSVQLGMARRIGSGAAATPRTLGSARAPGVPRPPALEAFGSDGTMEV